MSRFGGAICCFLRKQGERGNPAAVMKSLAVLLFVFSLLHIGGKGIVVYICTASFCLAESACGGGSVRLVGGTQGREGRVEYCRNNIWGTVCDDYWGTQDARVICRMIGYSTDGEYI